MPNAFIIKGITDEQTTCDKCGKSNLKRTVALESEATGLVYYGSDCAMKVISGRSKVTKTEKENLENKATALSYVPKALEEGKSKEHIINYCSVYLRTNVEYRLRGRVSGVPCLTVITGPNGILTADFQIDFSAFTEFPLP